MRKLALASILLLSACVEPAPAVSEFNGSSVTIQQSTIVTVPNHEQPEIIAEAKRICGKVGKRAEYASTRSAPNAAYADHLFLCL